MVRLNFVIAERGEKVDVLYQGENSSDAQSVYDKSVIDPTIDTLQWLTPHTPRCITSPKANAADIEARAAKQKADEEAEKNAAKNAAQARLAAAQAELAAAKAEAKAFA